MAAHGVAEPVARAVSAGDEHAARARTALAPDALGVGLRAKHHRYVLEHWPKLDYFELISENFMSGRGPARRVLDELRERYTLVLHGVGLNLLGAAEIDGHYLERLCWLAQYVRAPFVSDHLCWTASEGVTHHDLLPTPYTTDLIGFAAERAAWIQRQLGRPFGLENLSSYVQFEASTLCEWDFYGAVVEQAGCGFMLDINNLYVSSVNHGFDPLDYLAAIDMSRVLQVHLAGHSQSEGGTLIDTHDAAVCPEVWDLYRAFWQHGAVPTLLEWDARLPEFDGLLSELERARAVRA